MEILHTNKPLQKGAITLKEKETIQSPILDETLPHQMNFPSFKGTGKKMQQPFVNQYDVVIGDSKYNSENSPLNNWSDEVDPAIMAGDEWIHPTNDIGWIAEENQELLKKEVDNKNDAFMHPQFGIND
ncbi:MULTISPECIES: DUF3905 domain-containing protein [Bacillus]|jgi:hypothetical protein|uniref:DUF3905 domain-containing protein n=1 Tax=Bacillus toyonensis TaxID=155322 RepID=A0ABX6G495_9BACI|nr:MULTISPECIES: DUF3905 domain-containing protein [Bacillus]EEL23978.1 hypothetical protein bcere0017_11540 [Bacillus cereus Rock1-3]EEL35569.1 hypothetical protein bcere0019_11830 [Bacillus cereus Rock3-28]EEL41429.1 hypothetical protein bcere0020_11560 [Bacillus cereus Rock3-29]EOP27417.1 hypothetical protein IIS_00551 [Bacillus cereus VD131]KNH38382.1 hypothetical protein ACS75_22085 [Bacillus thuringiensis]KXY16319.1 hypothetical protein AT259_22575 [Bacillus cereus]MDH8704489.1 hypothe